MTWRAFFVTKRGNSMASMPRSIRLYVFIGSGALNGGLQTNVNNVIQVKDEQGPRSTTTSLSVKYDYAMIYGYRKLI